MALSHLEERGEGNQKLRNCVVSADGVSYRDVLQMRLQAHSQKTLETRWHIFS